MVSVIPMIVNFLLYDFYKSTSDSKKYSFFVLLSILRVFKYKIIKKKFEEIYNINKILKNINDYGRIWRYCTIK